MSKIYKLQFIIFLFAVSTISAQFSEEFNTYSKLYPENSRVRLLQETVIKITQEDDKLIILEQNKEEDLYLNESATYNSKSSVSSSFFFELNEINASSYTFENGKYVESKVEKFTEKDELNDSFYDDSKTLSFIYPKLKKGSKSVLEYSQNIKNPRFLSPFFFGDYFPIIKNKVTIIADKGIELSFKEFNTTNANIKFTKEEKRKKTIYTWVLENQDEFEYESGTPSYTTILPHIVPIINSYKVKKETKKLLGEVSDLYNWYYSLVENVNKEAPDPALVNIVNTITKDKNTDLEKVKAIYYWAQKNIKYIAFEYALGGFIPRESNEVFRKKYGDCKDNSSILFKMLEIAGVKGNLTWIGTRSIPYTYQEVPTPVVDNHMILSYEENGKTYYLDATGRYIKFGLPSSFIQGKEALVSFGNEFKVKTVPVVDAKENAIIDSTTINIKEDVLVGNSITHITGYPKINYFNSLENINSESKLKGFYNARFIKGNNKFLINKLEEINKYDYDEDFIINYDFEIKNYFKKLGDEIYINLNLNKDISALKADKKREYAIEYDFKRYQSYVTKFNIPEGYAVDYMPENVSFSNDLITCKISYELKENAVFYKQDIELNFLVLTKEQQTELNKLIKKIEKQYKEIIVLKKQ
ncbi:MULTISPECIES: DUF3857 domain-containing protein [Polaribacter]|uniref:DUF3857 domain-containing protein n=1 Tax=Polaribacter TaxID=52959 RepID=UPI0020919590|nr:MULTISPECIES: DUF3857 domain-containing protein [Polaribacter]MDO6741069.1 DUF3857 domain-containing protein [Polaribacter sp. 1_MG-2023]